MLNTRSLCFRSGSGTKYCSIVNMLVLKCLLYEAMFLPNQKKTRLSSNENNQEELLRYQGSNTHTSDHGKNSNQLHLGHIWPLTVGRLTAFYFFMFNLCILHLWELSRLYTNYLNVILSQHFKAVFSCLCSFVTVLHMSTRCMNSNCDVTPLDVMFVACVSV